MIIRQYFNKIFMNIQQHFNDKIHNQSFNIFDCFNEWRYFITSLIISLITNLMIISINENYTEKIYDNISYNKNDF